MTINSAAIIPARGGSKGIPSKNVRMLAGKPLIAHTIEAAASARQVGRVVVSTDDPEIAAVSQRYGADVVWRPEEISGDAASSESALLHGLEHLQSAEGYAPDILVFLQCTSPLTLACDIDGTVGAMLEAGADTALAVAPFHYFLWKKNGDGSGDGINHDKRVRLLRQERAPQYRETGAVYAMRVQGFLEAKHRFFGKTAIHLIPLERCLEIDDPVDLEIAEVLMRADQRRRMASALPRPVTALVMDFDGVFTDNRVLVGQDGSEAALCHRGDGWGLSRLRDAGLPMAVISSEENPVVQARCAKLGIACMSGIRDKLAALQSWAQEQGADLERTVYLGNDVNDLECLRTVGCGAAVRDAHPEALASARIVLDNAGGQGAIRELADLILSNMGGQ